MKAPSYLPTPIQAINSTPDVRLSHRKFCQGKEVNYLLPRNTGITWDTLLLSFLCFSSVRKESLVTLWSLQGQLDFCSLIHHSFFFQIPSIQFRSRTPKGASRSHRDNPLKLTPFIYKTELDNCCGIKRGVHIDLRLYPAINSIDCSLHHGECWSPAAQAAVIDRSATWANITSQLVQVSSGKCR